MPIRTIVGFVADFSTEPSDNDTPGRDLAAFVTDRLRSAGFATDEPDERGGWAWEIFTKKDNLTILSIVGLVDDMESDPPRQWLITNNCELGFFKRMFGGKGLNAMRDNFLRELCEELHQILCTDTRFSEIVWYEKETFDQPNDQPGTKP